MDHTQEGKTISSLEKVEINSEEKLSERRDFIDDDGIAKLSSGLLQQYEPHLKKVKAQLDELTKKQSNLIEQLKSENNSLSDAQTSKELQEMFTTIKFYHAKLISIKKEMISIHERTAKLKKRAMKVQALKHKELLQRQHERELQLQREQELVAKPTPKSSKKT